MIRSSKGRMQLAGFLVMMAGFSAVALAAAFCGIGMAAKFITPRLWNIASACAVAGLAVYAVGRILLAVEKRRRTPTPADNGVDGDRS